MPDAINLESDRFGDVVADQLKPWMADPLGNVGLATGEVVVETDHVLTGSHEPIDEMGADKTGPSGDQMAQRHGRQRQKGWC